jgi:hypothetical protein
MASRCGEADVLYVFFIFGNDLRAVWQIYGQYCCLLFSDISFYCGWKGITDKYMCAVDQREKKIVTIELIRTL